jgi:copper chaperone CopZ
MKSLTYSIPAMYADHHVLRVRGALAALAGVSQVEASAASRKVSVDCEDSVAAEEVEKALVQAGYSPDEETALAPPVKHTEDGSSWYAIIKRTTETEMKDLEMSGDHRRY